MAEVGVIEVTDKKYPKALKEALKNLIASSGPKRLYYKGSWDEEIFKNCLAVVGSRHLTFYGRKVIEQIVTEAAAAGITIVSGFMYGGDEAAHSAAVKAGGRTIAVMPCGINRIHPETQKKLYQEILDKNGLIISEYEGDAQPQTFTYIQRDRIVAGLSKSVFVVEAALNSGSLLTAGYAKKYGRKVFALPGQITSQVSQGTIKLIREGAEAVSCANDILSYYKVLVNPRCHSGLDPESRVLPLDSRFRGNDNGSLEDKILAYLRREPMKADEMARALAVPVAQLGTALSLMQLKGIINNDSGKYYLN
jgi:DNA processing protein